MQKLWSFVYRKKHQLSFNELERLHQQIVELSAANQELKGRLQTIETQYLAKQNEQFEGNIYRKVLVSSFTDDVINKVRATGVIGGIALFGVLWTSLQPIITAAVERTVERQLPGVMAQVEEQRSDDLLLLLEITNQGRTEGISELIQRRDDFRKLLQEFIDNPEEENTFLSGGDRGIANKRRESAILYAFNTKDSSLLNSLFNICHANDVSDAHKILAFRAILEYKSLNNQNIEDRIYEEILLPFIQDEQENDVSENEFLGEVIKILSSIEFEDTRVGQMMSEIASRTSEPSVIESITAFFILNPHQWKKADAEAYLKRADLPIPAESLAQLVAFPKTGTYSREDQYKLTQTFDELDKKIFDKEGINARFVQHIKKDFSIRLLRSGNTALFEAVRNSSGIDTQQIADSQYYAYDVWLKQIAPLFEGFTVSGIDLELIRDDRYQTDQRFVQDELWYQFSNFYWAGDIYKRITPASSVEMLRRGDYSQFFGIMRAGYYEPDFWRTEVIGLFRDRLPDTDVFAGDLTGTNEQQDALWRWVEKDRSIPELKAGQYELFLSTMNREYYDSQVWLTEIVPLFPALWQSDVELPLDGNEMQQDLLRRWIEDNINAGKLEWNSETRKWQMVAPVTQSDGGSR